MKKRILSILLCLCMVLSYMPIATAAENAVCTHHEHDENCGFGQACSFDPAVCAECAGKEGESLCTCESEDGVEHLPFCDLYVRTYEACKCVLSCKEEGLNDCCEACYFEGVEVCNGGEEKTIAWDTNFVIDGTTLDQYVGTATEVVIPDTVSSIASYAFEDCDHVTSVTIPNSVTSIGSYAFKNCKALASIAIPNSVTEIQPRTFENCTGLTSVSIPNSVTVIDSAAFYNCSGLISVTLPTGLTNINSYIFAGCSSLESVTVQGAVTAIESYAFENCSKLRSISLPSSVGDIAFYAFVGCTDLTEVNVPCNWTGLTTVDVPCDLNLDNINSVAVTKAAHSVGANNVCTVCEKTVYTIDMVASEGGTATADKAIANVGETVTITATPNPGYAVKTLTVTPVPMPCSLDDEDDAVAVTDNGDGTYSFTMPASNVKVNVTFEVPISAMQIFIQVSSGTPIALEVKPTDRIEDIKLKIQEKTGIAPDHQRLLYAGKQLEDSNTLQDYSIQKDATITVVETYDVWVGGVQITSEKLTINGDTGTATFDPATNTLTLNNFSHTSEGYEFNPWMGSASIYATLEHLTVNLVDSNTVACSAESGYALHNYGALTITTDDTNGSLALTGNGAGIWVSGNLIINGCQVNATGITSNGTIAITNSFVTANGARHGIAVVHAEEGEATEMKSDDLTITNSTVVATGGEYALFYDGGHNEEDESSIRGGLIPKLVFDNKFAAVAGSDAESAVMAAADAAATYENKHVRIVSAHDVTYKADGEVVKTLTVEHGKDATAPAIPVKEGYNETAPKWDADGKNITADTTINAVYTKNQPGEYADVTAETNVGGGKVTEEIGKLKEKVPFTPEEKLQIEYGADVEIWLEIKDISKSVPTADQNEIEKKLGAAKVGMYLDITMYKQVGENEASRLNQLGDRVQICFKLADSLINTDKNVTRTYSIIRVHNGKAEIITPVFDAATKTLTFETDRFSTYAVVYSDVENVPPTQETTPPADTPATGDSFHMMLWATMLVLSVAALIVLLAERKRLFAKKNV